MLKCKLFNKQTERLILNKQYFNYFLNDLKSIEDNFICLQGVD